MIRNVLLASTLFLSFASHSVLGATYTVDTAHSSVEFTVKHLMISNVKGIFKDFNGTGTGTFSKDQASIDSLEMEIKVDSIDTNEPKRDSHLKAPEIFDAAKFKTIVFKSTKIEYAGKFPSKIHGNMTLHGVTKPVAFAVNWGGFMADANKERVAFEAETEIHRKDFGITWNKALETGGVVVSDEVKIKVSIEATRELTPPVATTAPAKAPTQVKKK